MDVRNCKSCGKLFNYSGRPLCPACMKELEKRFGEVKEYIRENPNSTITQVSEATDVSVNQIRNWIREERLILSTESSIGIECERCGKPIRTGRMCQACKQKVTKDFKGIQNVAAEMKKESGLDDGKNRMRYLNK